MRIDSSISFHLSKLSNAKFSILYDISLVRDWKRKSWLITAGSERVKQFWVMYYLKIQGLFKALCKCKHFPRQAVKFKGFSIMYEPCIRKRIQVSPATLWGIKHFWFTAVYRDITHEECLVKKLSLNLPNNSSDSLPFSWCSIAAYSSCQVLC